MPAYLDPETRKAYRRIHNREVHFLTTARTSQLSHPWWIGSMSNLSGSANQLEYVVPPDDVNRFVLVFRNDDNSGTYTFWMRINRDLGVWQCIERHGDMTYAQAVEHVNTHFIEAARHDAEARYNVVIE